MTGGTATRRPVGPLRAGGVRATRMRCVVVAPTGTTGGRLAGLVGTARVGAARMTGGTATRRPAAAVRAGGVRAARMAFARICTGPAVGRTGAAGGSRCGPARRLLRRAAPETAEPARPVLAGGAAPGGQGEALPCLAVGLRLIAGAAARAGLRDAPAASGAVSSGAVTRGARESLIAPCAAGPDAASPRGVLAP